MPIIRSLALEERQRNHCFRRLRRVQPLDATRVGVDGKVLINFSSNDYLGLSKHPFLKARAIECTERYGVGSGSSRLVCGNSDLYEEVEARLAQLKGKEAALIFSTGFQLNFSVLQTLSHDAGAIYCDRLSHNSLLLGAQTSGIRFSRFAHNDLHDLDAKLQSAAGEGKQKWVVTESVFGMDGDLAPLADFERLRRDKPFDLFIDEAHATGVFGKNGLGLADEHYGATLTMGTFSKGAGSFGSYVACTRELKDYLINFCPGFIYTTALPPAVLGAIDAALTLIPTMAAERTYLLQIAHFLRQELRHLGFMVGNSESQIVPIIIGDELEAESLAAYLFDNGIFASAIKPPTVPAGTSRLRLSLSAMHTEPDITRLLNLLRTWHGKSN